MSDWGAFLDVAIGLVFFYLMTSLLVTIVQEGLASMLQLRARTLFDAIENLVGGFSLAKDPVYKHLVVDMYRHPLMQSLYRQSPLSDAASPVDCLKVTTLPSYIPSRIFAIVLVDVLREKAGLERGGINRLFANAPYAISKLPPSRLKATLELLVSDFDSLGLTMDQRARAVTERIEHWFDDAMARASGWYKRQAQRLSLVIALVLTILLNAHTFNIAGRLWTDNLLRVQITATASAYYKEQIDGAAKRSEDDNSPVRYPSVTALWNDQMSRLRSSSLPIGWSADVTSSLPASVSGWFALLFGWLVTALAASLGAAFWFDTLGKALQIRGSGPRIGSDGSGTVTVLNAPPSWRGYDDADAITSATVAVSTGQSIPKSGKLR